MSSVPEKYAYTPPDHDRKAWLYEMYWTEFLSTREIADRTDVSPDTIKRNLRAHGIPRRGKNAERSNNVSLFDGFYRDDEVPRMDPLTEQTSAEFEPSDPRKLQWQKTARSDPAISDDAVIEDWEPEDSKGSDAPYRYTIQGDCAGDDD